MNIASAQTVRFVAFLGLFFLTSLLGAGCKKSASSTTQTANQEPGPAQRDVCGLIKDDEMEAIVGSPIKETKGSGRSDSGMRMSQCYYAAAESSRSVSLAVTDRDPSSNAKRGANDYWEEMFGRYDKEESERESEADKAKKESLREQTRRTGEEEEGGAPPKKITGAGDEAFWSSNRVGGALYVLDKKKNTFVRVSVGGGDTEEKKIEKSKALAQKALSRL